MLAFWQHQVGLPFEENLPAGGGVHQLRRGMNGSAFEADPGVPADAPDTCNRKLRAPGFRYLTIQVWDVDAAHREVIDRGGMEGFAPVTLGRVARIAFVRDPDGNWIELSQRALLTGPLTAPTERVERRPRTG